MLKKFTVENFKGFKDKMVFNLGNPGNYGFNAEAIENGCVMKGIIYGKNGSGKSNLGLAIFDLITHLTDKNRNQLRYDNYIHLGGRKSYAEFEYVFEFDGHELTYRYQKNNVNVLTLESLSIDDREVIFYDFIKREGFTVLSGTDMLNATICSDSPISRVKYVYHNSILPESTENQTFRAFYDFIEHMLLFYSLDSRGYEGFMNGQESVSEGIIKAGKVKDFEAFLHDNEIDYELYEKESDGHQSIYCRFENRDAEFFSIASTGTRSLALFYYWFIRMEQTSFVFIDEFDAFYHYELSESIVRKLKEIGSVQIFATTHNTDLMNNDLLRPDCYYIINKNQIKMLPDLTEKELRQAHNLQKMYKAGVFDV